MRLNIDPNLPTNPALSQQWLSQLSTRLTMLFRDVAQQVNGVTEGKVSAITNAYTSYPTSGTWSQGDFIRNSAPSELGIAGSKYVILGWVCTAAGSPGTWVSCRALTGN